MRQNIEKLYPSAPLETIDLEQRLEKKTKDVKSFKNSISNIKDMITYFKKNQKSKSEYKSYKTLSSILEAVDKIVSIGSITWFITLSVTANGLIVVPFSPGFACALSLAINLIHRMIIIKYNIYRKQYEKDQQSNKCFNELCRKVLQGTIFLRNENESLCDIFTKYLEESKNDIFYKI